MNVRLQRPLAFRPACIACGAPATRSWRMQIKEGFNLLLHRWERRLFIDVPVCARCWQRRFLGAFVTPGAITLAIVCGAIATALRVAGTITAQTQLIAIFAVLAAILVLANAGSRWIDYRILGVCGVAFDDDSVTLRFRGDVIPPSALYNGAK